ncbi:MAG: hypothetical protein ACPG32_09995 [Akkermansiaceae bacterium]
MKKIIQSLSLMPVLAVSAFALSSCSTGGGCGADCSKACCAKKSCKAGCSKACCATKKTCATGCSKACCAAKP